MSMANTRLRRCAQVRFGEHSTVDVAPCGGIASSPGSTESLVVRPALRQPRGFTAEQVAWSGIGPGTVRLSVGIEDADDLITDLRQALEHSGR
jgi:cystathionine beta-lyase/cystathionine gamma-synthase